MFNLNTVAFIILILIIIIAIIALLKVGMNSRDAFGITKSSPQETFTTRQSFQIKHLLRENESIHRLFLSLANKLKVPYHKNTI